MHFVIMGCGRVGSTLAHILEAQGHSVAVIDRTYGHLLPDARDRAKIALDAFVATADDALAIQH